MKKQVFLVSLLFTNALAGCSGIRLRPEGTKITVSSAGEHWGSQAIIYNNAAKNVIIVPKERGNGFPAEYELGKKSLWCLGLCRKTKIKKLFALSYGEQIAVPLIANTTDPYWRKMTLELAVLENNQLIGSYFVCLVAPVRATVTETVIFGKKELHSLKIGNHGYACQNYFPWYLWY